jgi:hypothetical protein
MMGRRLLACLFLAVSCATGSGRPGAVGLLVPQPTDGDETAIAWPFVVTHEGGPEIVADFHLQIEEGGTLIGVRPNGDSPDPDATIRWSGVLRNGEGYWIGDVLSRGASVRLWALVRPIPGRDPELRVLHWPTDGRDNPVADPVCEVWRYDARSGEAERDSC